MIINKCICVRVQNITIVNQNTREKTNEKELRWKRFCFMVRKYRNTKKNDKQLNRFLNLL